MNSDLNRDDIVEFWRERGRITDVSAARFHLEHTVFDLSAIRQLIKAGDEILDLGCGTCTIANAIIEEADVHVHAVDIVPNFLNFGKRCDRLTTEIADIVSFKKNKIYDLILLLGVINSIPSDADRLSLYENCAGMIGDGAYFFIKSQFGRSEPFVVNKYSKSLGCNYKAIYPSLPTELSLLKNYFRICDVIDPYPDALNPHVETRFHHIIASSK